MAKSFKRELVDEVIKEIKEIKDNLEAGDETAIDCMLEGLLDLPGADEYLLDFLPEEASNKIRKSKPREDWYMKANTFKVGDKVLVTPKADDVFQNEFVGFITGTHDKYWTVEDGDGDSWDCDEDQIQHEEY